MSEFTMASMLRTAGLLHPEAVAYIEDGAEMTLGAAVDRAARVANALTRRLGLARGDRFGVLGGTSTDYIATLQASMIGSSVAVPLNTRLAPPELAGILHHSGACVLFVDSDFEPMAELVRQQLDRAITTVGMGGAQGDLDFDE